MYQARGDDEKRLIEAIANGDCSAHEPYADLLEQQGELARAMFLRFDPSKLDAEWLAALGWVICGQMMTRLDPAGREVLSLSSGQPVLPTQTVQISARSRTVFQPTRLIVSNSGTMGGAADWIVNDLRINNRSQFRQRGDMPGDLFATNAIDQFILFNRVLPSMDVALIVTYIGLSEAGVPFFGALVGVSLEADEDLHQPSRALPGSRSQRYR